MLNWYKIHINSVADIKQHFSPLSIKLVAIDTETTGLHIILDKPFLMSIAVLTRDNQAYAFSIPINTNNIKALQILVIDKLDEADKILLFNTKYDCHMLYNMGIDLFKFKDKITDVSIYARIASPAISPREGGPVLKLKLLAEKFIDKNARVYEHRIAMLKKEIKVKQTNMIKKLGFKIKDLDEFLSDKTNSISDLPPEIQKILTDKKLDPNNYSNINPEDLKIYAIYDAIYTLELYLYFLPICIERKQEKIIEIEEKNIYILWKMERCGFKLNQEYLYESKKKLKKYILDLRKELERISGVTFKIGQHKEWKEFFAYRYGIHLKGSSEDQLQTIKFPNDAKRIAEIIVNLRSLEKWYSTYICKWETDGIDRIYTSFNQTGAVSGRFSSDFQQFPKEPLLDEQGNLIYNPRRLVKISGEGYNSLVFIDFSSEELRLQALYTILVGHPDLNLCRAYMPYQCKNELNEIFDYKKDLKTFKNHTWYLIEDPKTIWTPTDLHDKTTFAAFPELTKGTPEFKHCRKMAKSTNFACNYGANVNTLIKQFGFSEELANKLYNAYNTAFPGIKHYKDYVAKILEHQNYITNLFGRRYYDASSHKCCNYLIQGSGADYLKLKLIEIDKFLEPYKSRIVCTIHDEIVYEIYDGEEFLIPQIKAIMENLEGTYVPMVSEVEITHTTWDEKE